MLRPPAGPKSKRRDETVVMTRTEAHLVLARARAELVQLEGHLAIECSCGRCGSRTLALALVCGLRIRPVLACSDAPDVLRVATDLDARWRAVLPTVHR